MLSPFQTTKAPSEKKKKSSFTVSEKVSKTFLKRDVLIITEITHPVPVVLSSAVNALQKQDKYIAIYWPFYLLCHTSRCGIEAVTIPG